MRYLDENPQEADHLFHELLIGVTGFFRDPEAWQELIENGLPQLLAAHPEGGTLRAWVAGCSTGEEAYSLAIAFQETVARLKPEGVYSLQIFATDLNRDAIEKARHGRFSPRAVAGVSPQRLETWFRPDAQGFRILKEIREMVVFAVQNVLQDPPFIRLDLLCCRNLLIYLSPDLQKRLLPLFSYSLNPGGLLFLGSAESLCGFTELFSSDLAKSRLFWRTSISPVPLQNSFPLRPATLAQPSRELPVPKTTPNLQAHAEQFLLQRFAPPAVLTTDSGDILYISGRTGKFLEPAMGKANLNIFAMAREGLRVHLDLAMRKALAHAEPVVVSGIKVGTNGGSVFVEITVQALVDPESAMRNVMIVFREQAAPAPASRRRQSATLPAAEERIAALEADLRLALEELQTTREERQTSQEELKATNEELQSTNEELQSTNEELTTSKEELQSLNEELQTINAEQQAKVDELSASNNDIKNLLDATDIATLFLDDNLKVRRFTSGATRLLKLIPSDVGRPFTDLVSSLAYPDLAGDANEVLRTLASCHKEVCTLDGEAWYHVRILPYRTTQNVIAGVVITFSDITTAKTLEAKLRARAGTGTGEKARK